MRMHAAGAGLLALLSLFGSEAQSQSADPQLTAEGRIVAIDGARAVLTVDHDSLSGLGGPTRTEFPVEDVRLLERVRVGDRIRFVLAPQHGSHGVLAITELARQSDTVAQSIGAAFRWEGGWGWPILLFLLTAALVAVFWRQAARDRRRARHKLEILRHAVAEQQGTMTALQASLQDVSVALGGFARQVASDVHRMRDRIHGAREGVRRGPSPHDAATPVVVVRRGEMATYRLVHERLEEPGLARVVWDRRRSERRTRQDAIPADRRQRDRRGPEPITWSALGYLVVERPGRHLTVVA